MGPVLGAFTSLKGDQSSRPVGGSAIHGEFYFCGQAVSRETQMRLETARVLGRIDTTGARTYAGTDGLHDVSRFILCGR